LPATPAAVAGEADVRWIQKDALLERAGVASGDELWGIARVLADDPSAECIAGLQELAASPDIERRRAAIRSLGENPSGRNASSVVIAALADQAFQVVWAAVEAAADLGLIEANESIVSLLENSGPLQRPAVEALAEIWLPENFGPTLKLFRKTTDDATRKRAAWTLRQCATAEEWKELFDTWSIDDVPRHRVWSCELAGQFGGQKDIETVAHLENDVDGHVRRAASEAMRQLRLKE
jgi:hypothetical protein